jgi:hypothetical protein
MKKYINGVASEMTAEELTAFQNKQTEWQQEDAIRLAEEQAKLDAKVSGNQKLLDLGLTQAEATALTGYTPPVAE